MRIAPALALPLLLFMPQLARSQSRDGDFRWERRLGSGQVVHARNVNGDISVTPSSSGRVEIVGVRRGSGRSADRLNALVTETSDGVIVCIVRVDADDECDGNGYHHRSHDDDDNDWGRASMNLEIRLPSNVEIDASSVSGNVDVVGAQGHVRAASVSGDVRLDGLRATSVEARTVSGEITAAVETLTGSGALSFKSVSGDVKLDLPRNLDADLSMSSVSGQLDSEFQMTLGGGRTSRRRIEARIGRGGRELSLTTVSGDVRLKMHRD
jgi:Putative adhesin